MAATSRWRIRARSALPAVTLREVEALGRARKRAVWVTDGGATLFGDAAMEHIDDMLAFADAVTAMVSGELAISDDFEAAGPDFDLPAERVTITQFLVRSSAPDDVRTAEDAAARWSVGAEDPSGWRHLVQEVRSYVDDPVFQDHLIRQLLSMRREADAAPWVVRLLEQSAHPRAQAALVERVRRARRRGHSPLRQEALRALHRMAPADCLPSLLLEHVTDPRWDWPRDAVLDGVRCGTYPAEALIVLLQAPHPENVLYALATFPAPPEGLAAVLKAATRHPDPRVATGASTLLLGIDITQGMVALQTADLSVGDRLLVPRDIGERVPELEGLRKALGRTGASPTASAFLQRAARAWVGARAVEGDALPPWPDSLGCVGLSAQPLHDVLAECEAQEQAALGSYRDELTWMAGDALRPTGA